MNYRDVVWIAAVAAWPLACAHPAEIVPPPAPEVVAKPVEKPMEKLAYPLAAASTQTDNYHGTNVADPYRWLESDSPQTQAWIEAENKLTFGYLRAIPQRPAIRKRLETVWNYQKFQRRTKRAGVGFGRTTTGCKIRQSSFGRRRRTIHRPHCLIPIPFLRMGPWRCKSHPSVATARSWRMRRPLRGPIGLKPRCATWRPARMRQMF